MKSDPLQNKVIFILLIILLSLAKLLFVSHILTHIILNDRVYNSFIQTKALYFLMNSIFYTGIFIVPFLSAIFQSKNYVKAMRLILGISFIVVTIHFLKADYLSLMSSVLMVSFLQVVVLVSIINVWNGSLFLKYQNKLLFLCFLVENLLMSVLYHGAPIISIKNENNPTLYIIIFLCCIAISFLLLCFYKGDTSVKLRAKHFQIRVIVNILTLVKHYKVFLKSILLLSIIKGLTLINELLVSGYNDTIFSITDWSITLLICIIILILVSFKFINLTKKFIYILIASYSTYVTSICLIWYNPGTLDFFNDLINNNIFIISNRVLVLTAYTSIEVYCISLLLPTVKNSSTSVQIFVVSTFFILLSCIEWLWLNAIW